MTATPHDIALEPAAPELLKATSASPFLYQLPPKEDRSLHDTSQAKAAIAQAVSHLEKALNA